MFRRSRVSSYSARTPCASSASSNGGSSAESAKDCGGGATDVDQPVCGAAPRPEWLVAPPIRFASGPKIPHLPTAALTSEFSAVVRPVQECLALPLAASRIAGLAMLPDLRDVPLHRLPASDLT